MSTAFAEGGWQPEPPGPLERMQLELGELTASLAAHVCSVTPPPVDEETGQRLQVGYTRPHLHDLVAIPMGADWREYFDCSPPSARDELRYAPPVDEGDLLSRYASAAFEDDESRGLGELTSLEDPYGCSSFGQRPAAQPAAAREMPPLCLCCMDSPCGCLANGLEITSNAVTICTACWDLPCVCASDAHGRRR